MNTIYNYLALGDSYSVGESVPLAESFPYQTVQLLRKEGFRVNAPEIIAVTGWTSEELIAGITNTKTLEAYDFVTLLVGVNNQYRGNDIVDFIKDFETLLQRSLKYTNHHAEKVYVLSIPDWGVTPYAAGRDTYKIATEIDSYNAICAQLCRKYQVKFIEITVEQRKHGTERDYLATDGLHPNGKEYSKWAKKLADAIKVSLTTEE